MKTKTLQKNKVNVITLGCAKNLFDSEVLMAQLKGNGFQVTHESSDHNAPVVIVNTCGFIESAKEESIQTIWDCVEAKNEGLIDRLYVTGCLSERYKDALIKEIPEVNAFFGTRDLKELLKILNADYKNELVGERFVTTPSHFSYLKISEGCNRTCSFCAIPLMRGKHISTPIDNIIFQAKKLSKKGVKELILIAQDLSYYGVDINGKKMLSELVSRLAEESGMDWIRLHYAYPNGFPLEVIKVMNHYDNVCNYLDIPLQHGSDKILKAMRRGTSAEKSIELIKRIRALSPNIALRTTMIVGYPGETEKDFKQLCDFIEQIKFDRLGVFTYSHEEDTHAFKFDDNVPYNVKKERSEVLMELQQNISYKKNRHKIGKTLKVLIDRKEGNSFIGRTEYDSPEVDNEVLIQNSRERIKIGSFYNVEITKADHYDLYGTIPSSDD